MLGNWGVIGTPAEYGSRGAWIFGTNGYIGDQSILIGLEYPVRDYNGDGIPDTVHSVITCPVARPTALRDDDPVTGKPWTFEPDSGYFNPLQQSPAIRSQPSTWPATWPEHPEWGNGKWNGLRGPDSLAGDDEACFRMDDQNDARFNVAANNPRGISFHPDSLHPGRMGAGISVAVRYVQSAHPLFRDIFFRIYDITNQGTTDYPKVVFGTLTGTYIGVTSTENYLEYSNDASVYFPSSDFILSSNFPDTGMRNPLWQGPVGKFGEAFVETPAGNHIASCDVFVPANNLRLGNDEELWSKLLPGRYVHPASVINDTVATMGEDEDYLFGSGYFSLKAGETRRIAAVIAYGRSKDEIIQKILLARTLYGSGFHPETLLGAVTISSFLTHRFLSGQQDIQWTTTTSGGTVSIYYSPDFGGSWMPVALGTPNTGSMSWNTANFPDAAFGLLRIYACDQSGTPYGFAETPAPFTVNNAGNGTPFVRIADSTLGQGALVTQPMLSLPLLVGDAEWGTLTLTLSYRISPDAPLVPFETFTVPSSSTIQYHDVRLSELPNSPTLQLQALVTDGNSGWIDSTATFHKETSHAPFPPDRTGFSGLAEVPINVVIVDSSQLRGDTYRVTFSDTAQGQPKTFSVWNASRNLWTLNNMPLHPGMESSVFDGLALSAGDFLTAIDTTRTRWSSPIPGASRAPLFAPHDYRQPFDYRVVFYDTIADTSAPYRSFGLPAMPVSFRIYDARTNEKLMFIAMAVDTTPAWPYPLIVALLERVSGRELLTWEIDLPFTPGLSSAHAGDTLYVLTKKGLSIYDTLTVQGMTLSVQNRPVEPASYKLFNNYPNPFNPSTTICFELPVRSRVLLVVFDILGREVATLVNEVEQPGTHDVVFDAGPLASGVYFYRLQAGGTLLTRAMVVLK